MGQIVTMLVLTFLVFGPVFAGAIYVNDTGQVAYGFRIVFSSPVVITSHAPSLPIKEPEGASSAFVFSGGEIPPRGSFWLSWRPGNVDVTGYEWLTASKEETVIQPSPLEASDGHILEETITAALRAEDGEELELRIVRKLSDRMIPFLVEYRIQGGGNLSFAWDLDHSVDSDRDGIFRNDADAVGPVARWIYPTNCTPYIVTLWARDGAGKSYRWEDRISFNVQNGDEVLLDATGFLPEDDIATLRWEVNTGDPKDRNFRISSPNKRRTTLVAEYPEFGHVILRATDMQGNQHEFDTLLYVFNKHPELFKVRGVRTNFWLIPEEFGYLNLALEYLKDIGFNWIKIPIYWGFRENSDGTFSIFPFSKDEGPHEGNDELLEEIISVLHDQGFGVELGLEIVPAPGTNLNRNRVPMEARFFEGPEGYFNFVRHYIDIANRTGVEVFVGKTEMTCTDFYKARPWMDRLIEIMRQNLISSEYTFENFFGQWASPKPWDPRYGTDLNKLNLIEWSAYVENWARSSDPSISELKWALENRVLYAFTRTQRAFPHLRQRIEEFGVPSFDGGAMFKTGVSGENREVDYEEQRRSAAAILRALMDYIKGGNDFFEG